MCLTQCIISQVTITCHTLGGTEILSSVGWNAKIQVLDQILQGLSESAAFLLCPHVTFSLCTCTSGCISSHQNTSPIGLEPHSMTSFNLSYFLKDFISKIVTLGVRASMYVLGCVDSDYISWYIRNWMFHSPENVLLYLIVAFKFVSGLTSFNPCVTGKNNLFLSLRRRISYIQAFYSSSQCDHLGSRLVTQARPVSWNYYWSKLKEDFYPF